MLRGGRLRLNTLQRGENALLRAGHENLAVADKTALQAAERGGHIRRFVRFLNENGKQLRAIAFRDSQVRLVLRVAITAFLVCGQEGGFHLFRIQRLLQFGDQKDVQLAEIRLAGTELDAAQADARLPFHDIVVRKTQVFFDGIPEFLHLHLTFTSRLGGISGHKRLQLDLILFGKLDKRRVLQAASVRIHHDRRVRNERRVENLLGRLSMQHAADQRQHQ